MARARYVYKCLPAPRRARKGRGHRTPAEALTAAMEAVLSEQGAAGWEYLRTDLVPMEAKWGVFSRWQDAQQGVMVFRRPAAPALALDAEEEAEPRPLRAEPGLAAARRRRFEDEEAREAPADIPRLGAARVD